MSSKQSRLADPILLICGAIGMLVSSAMACSTLHGRGALGCEILALVCWAGVSLLLLRYPLFGLRHTVCAIAGLYLCVQFRLSFFDYISPDYVSFLGPWTDTMRNMSVPQALRTPIGDYNMPYLYLLLLISRLPLYDLYCIKLISVLADLFLALAAAKLVRLTVRRDGPVLAAFFGALLAPTVFLNSAYWGQCDGVYACFALWGLYFGLKKRPVRAMILLALAFSFKLQAIFILPVAAFLLVREYLEPKHLAVFPGAFIGIMFPALLAGRSLSNTFGIYLDQTNAYPYLSLKAPSFWSLIPNDYFSNLAVPSVLLAGTVTLLLLYLFLQHPEHLAVTDLMDLALLFSLAIPWLLPRMHERYFYLAEILSVVYAACHPRRLPVTLILLGGGFLIYCSYLFGGMRILSTELLAALYGLTLIYLTLTLYRQISSRIINHSPSKEETHHEKTGNPLE